MAFSAVPSGPTGRENNRDSVSSGERKRKRPNPKRVKPAGVAVWVLWDQFDHSAEWSKSQILFKKMNGVGKPITEGENPVVETYSTLYCYPK